jgi:hypothetical protein
MLTGHSDDIGKLPWHKTFSNQSAYSNENFIGGMWDGNDFTPSLDQLRSGYGVGLLDYFNRFEPGRLNITPPLSNKAWMEYVGGK